MNNTFSVTAAAFLAGLGLNAQAQEITARVISSTPVIQQVQVPRTVCNNQPVAVQQPRSGAGALIGAIAGAALGNAIGHGSGRAAATGLGLVGGAALGDSIEGGGGGALQNMQSCSTQTFYENRTVAYNVTYEHNGRQSTVQMASDPGSTIRLQGSPVGSAAPTGAYPIAGGEVMSAPPGTVSVPAVVASTSPGYPTYSAPLYRTYAPAYYPSYYPSYYPPVGISLGFGFVGGGWGGHHHHRHRGGHRGHWR